MTRTGASAPIPDESPSEPRDAERVGAAMLRAGARSRIAGAMLLGLGSIVFLVSRMLLLDSDQAPWRLVHYSSVDEFHYLMPAFNLFRHGSWTFQAVPYAPVYGWPMNIWDNLVGWATLRVWGNTYHGVRMGAVLMGLGVFLAVTATVRAVAKEARQEGILGQRGSLLLTLAAMLFMLVDFSMLVVSRVAEPTGGRMLALAVLLLLTARGHFLPEDRSSLRPTVLLGLYVGASVMFVYVYNAFIVLAVCLAVLVWAWRDRWRGLLRHGIALAAGLGVSIGLYFGLVKLMYGVGVGGWYRTWISIYDGTGRGTSFFPSGPLYTLQSTLFRLNRPLLLLFLLSLAVFVWWAATRRRPLAILSCALMLSFQLQSLFLADYWGRKFVVVAPLVVVVIAVAIAWFVPFRSWVMARRGRMVLVAVWLVVAGCLFLAATSNLDSKEIWYVTPLASIRWSTRGLALLIAGLVFASFSSRRWPAVIAGLLVLAAVLVPSAWADRQFVYGHPTYKYRDAMIEIGKDVNGKVTAGFWSPAMQLYNSSDPQLSRVVHGSTVDEYLVVLVRFFEEGRATSLFAYAAPEDVLRLSWLGFKLVDTYDMNLPDYPAPRIMGRYVFIGRPRPVHKVAAPPASGSK